MATSNSHARQPVVTGFTAAFICLLFMAVNILRADPATNAVFAARAERAFQQAQARYYADARNPTNAWQFARTCFDWADFAKTDDDRAAIAKQGIAACRQFITQNSNSAPAHYYLAMDLGQLARTELLGALRLVREMEREFKVAAALDEQFDYAGPARNLGLLYLQAPRIGSIGDRHNARVFLEQAAKLAPDYPENRLNLAEAFLEWDDAGPARVQLDALDALWPKAQTQFTGDAWAESWADWTARRAAARQKLARIAP